jgi:hypothetical protein
MNILKSEIDLLKKFLEIIKISRSTSYFIVFIHKYTV